MSDSEDISFSDSDDEMIDLASIKYKPQPNKKPNKKAVISKEAKAKVPAKKQAKIIEELESKKVGTKKKGNLKENPSEEDVVKKRKMIILIHNYLINFPEKLKTFKKLKLERKSVEELTNLVEEMNVVLSNKILVNFGVNTISQAIEMLEMGLLTFTPINCNGLSNACKDGDTIDIMKQIVLNNTELIHTEPEYRLLYKILITTAQLHAVNSNGSNPINNSDEVIKKINSQYTDI